MNPDESLWSPVGYSYIKKGEQKALEPTPRRGRRLSITPCRLFPAQSRHAVSRWRLKPQCVGMG